MTAGDDARGRITEADQLVGRISLDGTLDFVVLAALFFGAATGAAYLLGAPLAHVTRTVVAKRPGRSPRRLSPGPSSPASSPVAFVRHIALFLHRQG